MSLFNFNIEEMMTFFVVLVRVSVMFSVLPFIGDRSIPSPVKILLSLIVGIILFPALVASGRIHPAAAKIWGATASGIIGTVAIEVIFALVVGYSARIVFDGIGFGANLIGNFMGFATANTFDPHQDSQTEVIAQIQTTLAMLAFLGLDGHHLMLKSALQSYSIVGIGKAQFTSFLNQRLVQMTKEVFEIGLKMSAPIIIALFAVNIAFGVLSRAMPQLNIFAISTVVSALLGFFVLFLGMPEFQGLIGNIFNTLGDRMDAIMFAMASGR